MERMTTLSVSVRDLPDREDRYCEGLATRRTLSSSRNEKKSLIGLELSEGRMGDLEG